MSLATAGEFAASATLIGAQVHRCDDAGAARAAVAAIIEALGPAATIAAAESTARLVPAGRRVVGADAHLPYVDVGVSEAVGAVVETGGVVLAPRTRWERLLAVIARVHVVLAGTATIVRSLDDLAPLLRGHAAPYVTHVCGPTRTADIERVITVGAHGPRELHVLLLEETGGG